MLLVVTRPAAQAAAWVDGLRALGCAAQSLPLIEIAPAADPAPVLAAWQRLDGYALAMFVSANAVQQFFSLASPAASWPARVRAGATGPGTTAALREAGVPALAIVEPPALGGNFDSEALWARLADEDWQSERVLVVRGPDGRDWFAETMRSRGARVDFVVAYQRLEPRLNESEQALLRLAQAEPAAHLWHFSSSEAVVRLQRLTPHADWSRSSALASHPRIAAAARSAGFGRVELVDPGALSSVARAVAAWPSIQSLPS